MADETPTTGPDERKPLSLLASERFGGNFKGDAEPTSPSEPAEPEVEEDIEAPAEGETDEAVEPEADEKMPEAEAPEGEDGEPNDEADEEPISTVHELVESQQWDPDWFNGLRVPIKVDGQTADVTIADLVASHQMGEAAEKRLSDAKTKAQSIIEDATKQVQEVQSQFAVAAKLIERAESLIDSEVSEVDWDSLREDDPAEYSARKEDIRERRERLKQAKKDAADEFQRAVQEEQERQKADFDSYVDQERKALRDALPAWNDPKTAEAEYTAIVEHLRGYGFKDAEIHNTADHRLLLLARDAMLHRQGEPKKTAAKKKLRTVPKVMKPGAPKPSDQINQEQARETRAKLRKSGSMQDAVAALRARRRPS